MPNRVLIPNDVQNLIDEIRPYLSPEMKEIDVIRTVLVDFKLHRKQSESEKLAELQAAVKIGLDQVERGQVVDGNLQEMLQRVRTKKAEV